MNGKVKTSSHFFFEMLSLEIWSTSRFILFLKWACNSEINEIWTLCSPYLKNWWQVSWSCFNSFLLSIPLKFLFCINQLGGRRQNLKYTSRTLKDSEKTAMFIHLGQTTTFHTKRIKTLPIPIENITVYFLQ